MLWLPAKKERTTLRRLRRLTLRLFLLLLLFFGLGAASAPPEHALLVQVDRVTAPYRFDFVNWESEAVVSEIWRRAIPPRLPAADADQRALVDSFLEVEQRRRQLEQQLNQHYAACPQAGQTTCSGQSQPQIAALEQELAALIAAQTELLPQVETILSRQVEAVLKEEGFTLAGQPFPPVAFRLTDPPTALILSPRDRIEKQHYVGLQPGLTTEQRLEIENRLEQRGDVSSYVTGVGGLGSYPTMVITSDSLTWLVEVIAHEWVHNYFYTFPSNIGWGYQTYPQLTTINETTADIVGQEIGRQVINRYYPEWADRLPPLDETGQPVAHQPSPFDLAMRRIRQQVDRLLAEGKIEQAEAYMEAERLKLVEQGYALRKLNQAYFAFHGSYATSPASIDPIGPQLRQLRSGSPSLKAFLNRAAWLNSFEDYLAWLDEAGIDPALE